MVAGRTTGSSQIVGMAIAEASVINSILTVRNPEGTAAALTIPPLAGGTRPVSVHLVITQSQQLIRGCSETQIATALESV